MFLRIWIGLFIQQQYFTIATFSFNQPRFRTNSTWNSIATTFPTQSLVGIQPHGIFVNSNNSIYIPNRQTGQIHIWLNENHLNPTKTISGSLSDPLSLFVTTNGDIYVDNGNNRRVDKWIVENETWISVMNVTSTCYGLFMDIYGSLYCSMYYNHRVDKKWSNDTITIIAGTGFQGSASDMLNYPHAIFVDINLDLYVTDSVNDRIQLFRLGQLNGTTVAGKGSAKLTIELKRPTGIVLDGDQHLFIVDHGNDRIIGSDENSFHCIFGCSGQGSTNDKLSSPQTMSFDSYGNIYVTDSGNNRVQKLSLSKKSDRKFENCSMFSYHENRFIYFVVLILSYNQPRFCLNTIWNSNVKTFADRNFLDTYMPYIFVNSNNSIYILNKQTREIYIWQNENDLNPTKTISGNLSNPFSLFVTTNGDIYVDNGWENGRVDKWIVENETWISVMNVTSTCYGLFMDIYGSLYCSMYYNHRVDKKWSNDTITIIAGTGFQGSASDMLNYPHAIFVDINLDLYVTDSVNDRIQLFRLGQLNGTTVAGKGSAKLTIELKRPTGIVLDGDQHLFIVDHGNDRIIGSDENGFRCIFGCSGYPSTNNRLVGPQTMSFDSYGNIYVTDRNNRRIQKVVKNNICGKQIIFDNFQETNRVYLIFNRN